MFPLRGWEHRGPFHLSSICRHCTGRNPIPSKGKDRGTRRAILCTLGKFWSCLPEANERKCTATGHLVYERGSLAPVPCHEDWRACSHLKISVTTQSYLTGIPEGEGRVSARGERGWTPMWKGWGCSSVLFQPQRGSPKSDMRTRKRTIATEQSDPVIGIAMIHKRG